MITKSLLPAVDLASPEMETSARPSELSLPASGNGGDFQSIISQTITSRYSAAPPLEAETEQILIHSNLLPLRLRRRSRTLPRKLHPHRFSHKKVLRILLPGRTKRPPPNLQLRRTVHRVRLRSSPALPTPTPTPFRPIQPLQNFRPAHPHFPPRILSKPPPKAWCHPSL